MTTTTTTTHTIKVWFQYGGSERLFEKFVGSSAEKAKEKYIKFFGSFEYGEYYIEAIEIWQIQEYRLYNSDDRLVGNYDESELTLKLTGEDQLPF